MEMEIITTLKPKGTDLDKKLQDSLPAWPGSISEASTFMMLNCNIIISNVAVRGASQPHWDNLLRKVFSTACNYKMRMRGRVRDE